MTSLNLVCLSNPVWSKHWLFGCFLVLLQKLFLVPQKLLEKRKTFFWSEAKLCTLYNHSTTNYGTTKVGFLRIFVQFCAVTSVAILCPQLLKTNQCNEAIKLLNDLLHPRHSSQSSVNVRLPFWIFPKNRWACSSTFILRPWSAPAGRWFGSSFLQEIHKLSTKTLWNVEERPI